MTEPIYLVILEDRHIDVEVTPFRDRDAAIARAREIAAEESRSDSSYEISELTPDMLDDGWLFHAVYSVEDDSVRVVQRDLI